MIATGVHPTLGAFFCFVFAVVFLGFSLGLYIWLTRSEFFQHYNGETPREAIEAKEMEKGNQYVTMQSLRREKWTYTTVDSGAPPNQYLWHLLTFKAKNWCVAPCVQTLPISNRQIGTIVPKMWQNLCWKTGKSHFFSLSPQIQKLHIISRKISHNSIIPGPNELNIDLGLDFGNTILIAYAKSTSTVLYRGGLS